MDRLEWVLDSAAMRPFAHERFSEVVTLTPTSVAEFASAAGDTNPVHRDPEFAAATRYARPIATGTHTTALLLGLTASYYSRHRSMVGSSSGSASDGRSTPMTRSGSSGSWSR
jgi:acyl dehydratase